jgi:hypothetical protein
MAIGFGETISMSQPDPKFQTHLTKPGRYKSHLPGHNLFEEKEKMII